MRHDFSALQQSVWYRLVLIWHTLSVVLAGIIGYTEQNYQLFLSLLCWTLVVVVFYMLQPQFFVLTGFVLSIIEETIIYYFGGGLQGAAVSLGHDFVNALPVFLGIILGWDILLRRYRISESQLFLLGGSHGIIIELVFQGIIFNPVLLFLFGGPTMFIYGSILVTPQSPEGEKEFSIRRKVGAWVFVMAMIIVGAIIADKLSRIMGF